jgi:phosphonate transport system substrate-binding protein
MKGWNLAGRWSCSGRSDRGGLSGLAGLASLAGAATLRLLVAALTMTALMTTAIACHTSPPANTAASADASKAGWPKELTLGLAGANDSEAAIEYNKPLAARLEKTLGIPVKFYVATNYSAVVEAMRAKRVEVMQTGVFSYLLAVQEAHAEAVAVMINTFKEPAVYDPALSATYYSVISVKKGRGINTLADLKGRTLNFVEPASTSGHLVPKTELIKAGLVPDRDVKTRFTGSHPASLLSLWHDKADAAATAEALLYNLAEHKQIEFCGFPDYQMGKTRSAADVQAIFDACPDGKIVALHYSNPIPATPIAVRGDLPASLKAAITASLLSTPTDAEFIRAGRRWYLDPSKEKGLANLDAYYNPLREIAKLLDLDLKTVD